MTEKEMVDNFINRAMDIGVANPDLMILMGDPVTDTIFICYKGKNINARMLTKDGKPRWLIRKLLAHRGFFANRKKDINTFLLFIDGALYDLSKALRESRLSLKNIFNKKK